MKHVFPSDLVVENETAAALRRTLAYLEEHGWCQGWGWGDGKVCVGSALSVVGGGFCSPAARALYDIVGVGRDRTIVAWNDSPLTTWDTVRSALLKAIEAA